jgi:hypothetical protein
VVSPSRKRTTTKSRKKEPATPIAPVSAQTAPADSSTQAPPQKWWRIDLRRKVGGLPIRAWILLFALLGGLALYLLGPEARAGLVEPPSPAPDDVAELDLPKVPVRDDLASDVDPPAPEPTPYARTHREQAEVQAEPPAPSKSGRRPATREVPRERRAASSAAIPARPSSTSLPEGAAAAILSNDHARALSLLRADGQSAGPLAHTLVRILQQKLARRCAEQDDRTAPECQSASLASGDPL